MTEQIQKAFMKEVANPIYFETPRLQKFYEHTKTILPELWISQTQDSCMHLLNTENKTKTLSPNDLFSDLLERTEFEFKSPFSTKKLSKFNFSNNKISFSNKNKKISENKNIVEISHIPNKNHNRIPFNDITNKIFEKIQSPKETQQLFFEKNFKNEEEDYEDFESYEKKNNREIRRRKRKSNQQLKALKIEFQKDGAWTKDKITYMAKVTGLSESQVYKWCWDQKKKNFDSFRNRRFERKNYLNTESNEKYSFSETNTNSETNFGVFKKICKKNNKQTENYAKKQFAILEFNDDYNRIPKKLLF